MLSALDWIDTHIQYILKWVIKVCRQEGYILVQNGIHYTCLPQFSLVLSQHSPHISYFIPKSIKYNFSPQLSYRTPLKLLSPSNFGILFVKFIINSKLRSKLSKYILVLFSLHKWTNCHIKHVYLFPPYKLYFGPNTHKISLWSTLLIIQYLSLHKHSKSSHKFIYLHN